MKKKLLFLKLVKKTTEQFSEELISYLSFFPVLAISFQNRNTTCVKGKSRQLLIKSVEKAPRGKTGKTCTVYYLHEKKDLS